MATRNRILSIGVELEGGWSRTRELPPNLDIRHDGSVSIPGDYYGGEVSCNPMRTTKEVAVWMRRAYPHRVNDTCGFHVHVAVNKLNYSRLMEHAFFDMFYQQMESYITRNHSRDPDGYDRLRTRLGGSNRFCRKEHHPEQQVYLEARYGDARYAALNFCFGRHGTLECRVFPCFVDVEDSILGMEQFCEIVNAYLAKCAPERPVQLTVTEKDIPDNLKPKPIHKKHVLDYSFHGA